MTAEELQHHIRYSGWASKRLLEAALALNEEQQHRELGVSHKSLYGTLEHTFLSDRIWFARTVDAGIVKGTPRELNPGETLATEWVKLQKRWEQWSDALTHQDLARKIEYHDMSGNIHTNPTWQIVLHVVNHATLHRGQAMSMLRQLGVAPPNTDLITYYRGLKVK